MGGFLDGTGWGLLYGVKIRLIKGRPWDKITLMVMRVQVVEGEYRVVLPMDAVEALDLHDGSVVEVQAVRPDADCIEHRSATVDEALKAFRRTEHLHGNTYRELAK